MQAPSTPTSTAKEKETFRRYLETTGVVESLSKALAQVRCASPSACHR